MIRKTILVLAIASAASATAEERTFKPVEPQVATTEQLEIAYLPLTREEIAQLEEAGANGFLTTVLVMAALLGLAWLIANGLPEEDALALIPG